MAKCKPKSYHQGANEERTAILAKVRRMIRDGYGADLPHGLPLEMLENWLLQRNERYKAKKGGL